MIWAKSRSSRSLWRATVATSRRTPTTGRGRTNRVSLHLLYICIISLPSDNVCRARAAHRDALDALKVGNLDDAVEAADEMMYLLALQRIINPLVEIDMAGHLVLLQIKVIHLQHEASSSDYSNLFSRFSSKRIQGIPR